MAVKIVGIGPHLPQPCVYASQAATGQHTWASSHATAFTGKSASASPSFHVRGRRRRQPYQCATSSTDPYFCSQPNTHSNPSAHGFNTTSGYTTGNSMNGHQGPQQPSSPNLTALYTSLLYSPDRFTGPIKAVEVQGCGAGLVATHDIPTGELILAVPPLALVYAPEGIIPETQAVADRLWASQPLDATQMRWLQLLWMDRGSSTGVCAADMNRMGAASITLPVELRGVQPAVAQQVQELDQLLQGTWQPPSTPTIDDVAITADTLQLSQSVGSTMDMATAAILAPAPLDPKQIAKALISGDLSPLTGRDLSRGDGGSVPTPAWVMEAVARNVLGEAVEDMAVCGLREQEPRQGYCGLWPEFALLNHSCAPNTVHLMVGGVLLVRTCRPVLAGEELTTNYLSDGRWSHVAARRNALRQQWGFLCGCERCTLEQELFPTVRYQGEKVGQGLRRRRGLLTGVSQWMLDRVFGEGRYLLDVSSDPGLLQRVNQRVAQQLEPDMQEALAAPSGVAGRRRAAVKQALDNAVAEVDKTVQGLDLTPREVRLLEASVYRLYRLRAEFLQLIPDQDGQEQAAALQQCCRILESVARGSDPHLYLALAASDRVAKIYGKQSAEARTELLAASNAHIARYGSVNRGMLQELMEVRRSSVLASWLGQRLGVLTWDSSVAKDKDTGNISN